MQCQRCTLPIVCWRARRAPAGVSVTVHIARVGRAASLLYRALLVGEQLVRDRTGSCERYAKSNDPDRNAKAIGREYLSVMVRRRQSLTPQRTAERYAVVPQPY